MSASPIPTYTHYPSSSPSYRDERLDTFRGLAMVWVVFNHVLFWMSFFYGSVFKSYFLIGTQLFFVIAGASNGMSRPKPLWEFYYIRFKRILFPYWFYCIITLIITIFVSSQPVNIGMALQNRLLYFNMYPTNPEILSWAVWFVPVYLLVMILFPFLRKYYEHTTQLFVKIIPLFLFAALVILLQEKIIPIPAKIGHYYLMDLAKKTALYGFFAYLGLFFTVFMQRSKAQMLTGIILTVGCAIAVVATIRFCDASPSMQNNKFPPNFTFLLFSLGVLGILYLASDYIIRGINFCKRNSVFAWIYRQYTKHGLTIFLFHPFVFLLLTELRKLAFATHNKTSVIAFIFTTLLALPLSGVIGYLFSWVENLAQIKIRKTQTPNTEKSHENQKNNRQGNT